MIHASRQELLLENDVLSKIVSRESAIIAGVRDSEVLSFSKDHKELVRFATSEDEDYKLVISHLKIMIGDCQDTVAKVWARQAIADSFPIDQRKIQRKFSDGF